MSTIRDGLTFISNIPSYEQKKIAERMGASTRDTPIPLVEFCTSYQDILNVSLINGEKPETLYMPFKENWLDHLRECDQEQMDGIKEAISKLVWMTLKSYERSVGNNKLKLNRDMLTQ